LELLNKRIFGYCHYLDIELKSIQEAMMLVERLNKAERLNRLVMYLYIPYQFLQIAGYRLVGKRCDYQWRKHRPEPIGPTTLAQHCIALIFPTLVCCAMLVVQIILASYLVIWYYTPQTPWPVFVFLSQAFPFCLYGAFMLLDFVRLRRVLSKSTRSNESYEHESQEETHQRQ
jgi:hypothetical protein